jgi:hypothetical protein
VIGVRVSYDPIKHLLTLSSKAASLDETASLRIPCTASNDVTQHPMRKSEKYWLSTPPRSYAINIRSSRS